MLCPLMLDLVKLENTTAGPVACDLFPMAAPVPSEAPITTATAPVNLSNKSTHLLCSVASATNSKRPGGRSQELFVPTATNRYNWLMAGAET